jgi:hypothetical protein
LGSSAAATLKSIERNPECLSSARGLAITRHPDRVQRAVNTVLFC